MCSSMFNNVELTKLRLLFENKNLRMTIRTNYNQAMEEQ